MARSIFYYRPKKVKSRVHKPLDIALTEAIRQIIEEYPAYGLRRITALLRKQLNQQINRKRIHRILKADGWQIRKRPLGKRPRALGLRSVAERSLSRRKRFWILSSTHSLKDESACVSKNLH